ncbi:hypothetical protein ACK8OR_09105 [Jannaschia sp. KMU-145]|uniref:hypothetical protein n=1 Tax=Jannaschia halovivens TaxID=3388667 RepID=UPI00396AF746
MTGRLVLAAALVALAAPAAANAPMNSARVHLSQQLPVYGFRDVDVRRLSAGQVVQLQHVLHSGRSNGNIRWQIDTILNGGLLQRGFDRVLR